MEPLYDPAAVERRWQEAWESGGLYAAGAGRRRDESFVICVPPPNVTGELHMGHALNGSIQDVLIRWHRMRGFDTLWQPGYDHAGISTQNVVEKQLLAEGTSRQELGRDAFLERTWGWLETTGRTIMGQYRRLGASLDYARERFTMDDGYVEAVMTFFVRLWEAGWIYRANRIVNWCPYHQTAISDLEVEHVEMDDTLSFVRYPFADGAEGAIAVATVRPATMLADVAVAVHPDDPRYRDAIGREVVVPVVERRVPVIADARVDPEFGTGAVKVTPGHDPMDFDIGRDHDLETLTVIGPDGKMIAEGFEGLDQKEADARVIAWAEERGLVEKREHYRHSVGTCERCHSRIEPLVSPQWWCAMEGLAASALEALRERRVRFHPESQHRFAIESLEQAPDWCVSRQLWWGHQIPIWTCPDGHLTCTWPPPDACDECGSGELERDPDVLDTWFSSALWPFATLGWPGETPELVRYYRGDVNSTAREIIRLWENRMIFSGLFLLGQIPFTDVIIHSTVLAADGRRMSKSLGTGVDPMQPIEAHGADATRYGLLKISSTQDVRYAVGAIEEGRKLAIKLWNVARLILQETEGAEPARRPASLEERWILARLESARAAVEDAWARFDFAAATGVLYHLTFDDFCDWYAEAIKPRLRDGEEDCRATALAALETLLSLLHPLMPHVTEEIWTQLPDRAARLIVSPWPEPDASYADAAGALDRVQEAAQVFRRSGVEVELGSDEERRIFAAVVRPERRQASGDVEAERARLAKEIARAEGMLANERFVANAPADVVEGERAKLERYSESSSSWAHETVCDRLLRLDTMSNVDWLATLSPWPRDGFGLDRMRTLLSALDEPQAGLPAMHIVGTNGKSTTTRMVEELLRGAGLRVGAYLSPHVRSWSERIRVEGEEADLELVLDDVRPAAERLEATQFEVLTAAAFVAFGDAGVEAAAIEAGLGGRHDATNVLDETRVVVLTNVSLEHTEVLGSTRQAIAAEKLAVIRPGCTVVLGEPEWEAQSWAAGAARVVVVPGERLQQTVASAPALAAAAAEAFVGKAPDTSVLDGIVLPGRLERRPGEIRDGAHNPDGVRWLVEHLPPGDYTVMASILADKDADAMLAALAAVGRRFVACRSSNARSLPVEELAGRARARFEVVETRDDPHEALELAHALGEPVLVTGSLYLLADLEAGP